MKVPSWSGESPPDGCRLLVVSSHGGWDEEALWGITDKGINLVHEGFTVMT